MAAPVIIDAARTPYGKRGGALAGIHAVELLAGAQQAMVARTGVDPAEVTEIIGGCVTQAGEQSNNVTRFAWLHAGLPEETGATTLDSQCGSAQQAVHLVSAQIAAGHYDIGMACGVEVMSRVPLLSNLGEVGRPRPENWTVDLPAQFEAADRIAVRRGLTREDLDDFGLRSQQRARAAWDEGRLDRQILPVTLPDGTALTRDEGLRDTSPEALAGLRTIREGGLHTAGTSSQISDGATVALLADEDRARALGLTPRARIRAQVLVGAEPHFLLDGPVRAAERLLARTGMRIGDIDLFEVNEAFAAVPMSFARVHGVDEEKLNVNGGAIALGHPVGSTGIRLIAALLDELERRDLSVGMVAICAGGAQATGAIIERI
ncbi:steroid 3-ketoacyl-CoA thiolase [Nocardioides sp. AE5]|uniref:steroid 3-ketoacyl-CoA thiolase n=1 Tax=Nocardioides sp. AE5 TaxID=2962573 RepID=UPI0028829BCC|nr:steroid 3-ketoacyl-CoA thiolase [Nocardioides sp. AE5]MDT0203847.1 steroid 3-ketoacyl-CoA thiolase [Nocardioides sp. AE5]